MVAFSYAWDLDIIISSHPWLHLLILVIFTYVFDVTPIQLFSHSKFTELFTKMFIGFYLKNNAELRAHDYDNAHLDITMKLDLYDMVDVRKSHDESIAPSRNYFEGWLMS